eukprot:7598743-Pyramimonas_sp.AAC.1
MMATRGRSSRIHRSTSLNWSVLALVVETAASYQVEVSAHLEVALDSKLAGPTPPAHIPTMSATWPM